MGSYGQHHYDVCGADECFYCKKQSAELDHFRYATDILVFNSGAPGKQYCNSNFIKKV